MYRGVLYTISDFIHSATMYPYKAFPTLVAAVKVRLSCDLRRVLELLDVGYSSRRYVCVYAEVGVSEPRRNRVSRS